MSEKNIVLVGFMGAGKTVTSQILAARLNRRRVSTDSQIVAKEGRSINDIFSKNGEEYFRDLETAIVCDLAQQVNLVIDCGGGVVLRPENMMVLKDNGVVVYLKAAPATIYERVKDDGHRPLLNVEDPVREIKDLLERRAECYAQADYHVMTDEKIPGEVAEEIIEIVEKDTSV